MTTVGPQGQDQIRAAWDAIAPAFDTVATPVTLPLAEEALRRVGVRPGTELLDVAAGSGALAIQAARLGARVVATDVSAAMIDRLRARAREEGLADLEGRVMDGHALDLPDGTFDVAASQNGVSLFPDVARGLRELARVLRPGGRMLIVAFASPAKAEFLTFFMGALKASVPGFAGIPMDPPPLPFQLADPERMRRELAEAGMQDVSIATIPWRMEIRSAQHLWDFITSSNPIGAMLVADLAEEHRVAAMNTLATMLHQRAEGRPTAVLTTEVHVGTGVKART